MLHRFAGVVVLLVVSFWLNACGEGQAQLTPQQQEQVKKLQDQLAQMKPALDKFMGEAGAKAQGEAKAAVDAAKAAWDHARKAADELSKAGGATFEEKVKAAQAAMAELAKKFSEAQMKAGMGGLKLPGM